MRETGDAVGVPTNGTTQGPEPANGHGSTASGGDHTLRRSVSELEKKLIAEALDRFRGNKARVARELGLSYPTLLSRIRTYGLEAAK